MGIPTFHLLLQSAATYRFLKYKLYLLRSISSTGLSLGGDANYGLQDANRLPGELLSPLRVAYDSDV